MKNEATVGGFLGETTSLLADARLVVGIYVAVVGGLTAIGVVFGLTETSTMAFRAGFLLDSNSTLSGALFDLIAAVVSIVAAYLLLRELLRARGRLGAGDGRFWAYVGMSILSGLGTVLGLILLIVPGVILMVRWSAASGFLLGDRTGVSDALSESWSATKGHGWAIFAGALLLFVAAAVASGVLGGIMGLVDERAGGAVSAFLEAAMGAVFMAFGIAVYCIVHDDADKLREVFA